MKKIMFSAAAAAIALVGCIEKTGETPVESGDEVMMTFTVPQLATKASGTSSDDVVNDLQIFVFGGSGILEAYKQASSSSLSMTCTTGSKQIVAVVNAPALTQVKTLTDLREQTSRLADNDVSSLIMDGITSTVLTAASGTVPINVYRHAARVAVSKIETAFELEQHRSMAFKVHSIYLINVAGDRKYLEAGTPSQWWNEGDYDEQSPALLYEDMNDTLIADSEPYMTEHYFYCYPNPVVADSQADPWTPRHTRLVVEASLDNARYFYPVTLPVLESNKKYDVTLKITRPGSTDADTPVTKDEASFRVSVQPWQDGADVNETI